MPPLNTTDPVNMEQTLVGTIRDVFLSVPLIASSCQVHTSQRFPDSDKEDIEVSTVPDFDNSDIPYTSIIEIGIPTVEETVYTSERYTQLTFVYPITFDAGVRDRWQTGTYPNSRTFAMAVYLLARAKFKEDVTLGYANCEHKFLQQESAVTVDDEESGGRLHTADWSLTVHVKGVDT